MKPAGTRTSSRQSAAVKLRFTSSITPYLDDLLRMRYQEDCTVSEVLAWLKEKGTEISRRSYQDFMVRVLRLMPLEQARELKVNADLLRAVRVRYKLSPDPRSSRLTASKRTVRHNPRWQRRKILPEPRPKVAAKATPPPTTRSPGRDQPEPAQLLMAGLVAPPAIEAPYAKLRGTPDKPDGYADMKIINQVARAKLAKANRHIYPNTEGTTIHISTRHEYTPEELVAECGLSPTEASTCFMTLDD